MTGRFWLDPFRELTAAEGDGEWTPRVDVLETETGVEVKAELPGLERKDIDITLDNDLLTIKGEKRSENEEKGRHFHRIERRYGTFYRTVRLPVEIENDKIEAPSKMVF